MHTAARRALVTALTALAPLVAAAALPVAACSASAASDASDASDANATACTWDDNLAREAELGYASGPTSMKVGDIYASPDGCNGCGCTAEGFRCTKNICAKPDGGAPACPEATTECPDGSRILAYGPNCVFPVTGCARTGCTAEVRQCPGSAKTVGRSGPFCTLAPCN